MKENENYRAYAGKNINKQNGGGSMKVRIEVIITDFILLNLIMAGFMYLDVCEIPAYFINATKVTVAVMNFAMIIAEYFFHTIIDRRILAKYEVFLNVLKLTFTQAFLMGVALRLLTNGGGLFNIIVKFFIVEFIVFIIVRYIQRGILNFARAHGRNQQVVLFVGNDPMLASLYRTFTQSPSGGYKVKGYYSDKRMLKEPDGLEWLGDLNTLNGRMDYWNKDVMHEPGIGELFCSLSHADEDEIKKIMHCCDRNIIHFFYVPRTFIDAGIRLVPIHFGDYIYYSNRLEPLLEPGNRFIKRVFDVCFSFVVCLFLIPITLIVGLIIKIQSPGPIFFKQGRTGLDGKTFYLYKFRSMHVNKDADTAQATENDPRKFPFGDFMRRANIDELPQFFNVLIGNMSIVGPRPHMLHHTELYGELIDNYMVRLFVKPGITGWAQVTGFRGETKELWQMEGRVNRDIWYVEHWSFGLDMRIIGKTIKSIFVHDKNAF